MQAGAAQPVGHEVLVLEEPAGELPLAGVGVGDRDRGGAVEVSSPKRR